jgi:hypothetical protein
MEKCAPESLYFAIEKDCRIKSVYFSKHQILTKQFLIHGVNHRSGPERNPNCTPFLRQHLNTGRKIEVVL